MRREPAVASAYIKIMIIKCDKISDPLLTTPMLAHLKASRPEAQKSVTELADDAVFARLAPLLA